MEINSFSASALYVAHADSIVAAVDRLLQQRGSANKPPEHATHDLNRSQSSPQQPREGAVIAYNKVASLGPKALTHFMEIPENLAAQPAIVGGLIGGLYNGKDFPYVVKFESGYQDVYADCDLKVAV